MPTTEHTVRFTTTTNIPGKLAEAEIAFPAQLSCPACKGSGSVTLTQADAGALAGCEARCNHDDCNGTGQVSSDHLFAGLKLIGFAVWERRTGNGRNVTFPARQYSVNGERRSFALLRPTDDSRAQDRIRDLILAAYEQHTAEQTTDADGFKWAPSTAPATPAAVPAPATQTTPTGLFT